MNSNSSNNIPHEPFSMILKIGGSILKNQGVLLQNLQILKNIVTLKHEKMQDCPFAPSKILIICGGGILAEKLRIQYKKDPDKLNKEDFYHWKAIECMDINAKDLYNFYKSNFSNKDNQNYIHLISEINIFQNNDWGIFIFQPLADLKDYDRKPQFIPLKHSWDVTSDSITLYYGYRLGLRNVVLVKDISFLKISNQLIQAIDSASLLRSMEDEGYLGNLELHLGKGTLFPVDPFVPRLIYQFKIKLIIINGKKINLVRYFVKNYGKFMGKNYIGEYGILIYPKEL